jgi:hypothetical protein
VLPEVVEPMGLGPHQGVVLRNRFLELAVMAVGLRNQGVAEEEVVQMD